MALTQPQVSIRRAIWEFIDAHKLVWHVFSSHKPDPLCKFTTKNYSIHGKISLIAFAIFLP